MMMIIVIISVIDCCALYIPTYMNSGKPNEKTIFQNVSSYGK